MHGGSLAWLTGASTVVIIATFLVTSAHHILHFESFVQIMFRQAVLPRRAIFVLAGTTVASEVSIVVGAAASWLFAIPWLVAMVLATAAGLLLVFAGYLRLVVRQGVAVPCGCGTGSEDVTWMSVARAVSLSLLAALSAWHIYVATLPSLEASSVLAGLILAILLAISPAALGSLPTSPALTREGFGP